MAYTKTNWVNDITPANETNMNNIETGIEQAHQDIANLQPNIITAGITADITKTTTTSGICPMELLNSVGSKLTIEGGAIKIGAGVSKVLANAKVLAKNNDSSSSIIVQAYIKKSSAGVESNVDAGIDIANSGSNLSLCMTNTLVSVSEGDTLYLGWWKGNEKSLSIKKGYLTKLTVEVVEQN